MKKIYRLLTQVLPSLWYCLISGIRYQNGWKVRGRIRIIKKSRLNCLFFNSPNGKLVIGRSFTCNNIVDSNSIGLIQPCVFNISASEGCIEIGDNVGISGSTICATHSVSIGNNVLIGSGCIITDTDAHPIGWRDRRDGNNNRKGGAPVRIGNDVFVGARSIILKGVTIGDRCVIGAGSVVTKNVPSDSIVAGNPARVIRKLDDKEE